MRVGRWIAPLFALIGACSVAATRKHDGVLTHGVAVGEVTDDSAVVWARCVDGGEVAVHVEGGGERRDTVLPTTAASDWTGRVRLANLQPRTSYEFAVSCGGGGRGRFRTAPPPSQLAALRIAWSGDLGGQNVCRDADDGYSIFSRIAAMRPDVFIGVGDMVYADDTCRQVGRYGNRQRPGPPPAFDLAAFRAHWAYNRDDPHLQSLLAQVPYVGVWDDHEIRDDGSAADSSFPPALQSFTEWLPWVAPHGNRTQLYRRLRWGKHAEFFVLDTRQHRDRNGAVDDGTKTLLGEAQRDWLLQSLRASDATWRIVVSSVPLSIPTGKQRARDGWADGGDGSGFEREAAAILRDMAEAGMRNLVWITTDVHFATGFRYRPFSESDLVVHEFVAGPLNAGVFPQLAVDPTFHPQRLFLWGPKAPADIDSYAAALQWFNFGVIDIDAAGNLQVSIINGRGEVVFRHALPRGS